MKMESKEGKIIVELEYNKFKARPWVGFPLAEGGYDFLKPVEWRKRENCNYIFDLVYEIPLVWGAYVVIAETATKKSTNWHKYFMNRETGKLELVETIYK